MRILGPALVEEWKKEIAAFLRTTEGTISSGLLCTHFPGTRVLIEAEDRSVIMMQHAFLVSREDDSRLVAVFTEHNGYIEVRLHEDDVVVAGGKVLV